MMARTPQTTDEERHAPRRGPLRTCVGCQAQIDAEDAGGSVRVVLGPVDQAGRAEVAVDLRGSSFGRGAHIHVRPSCIERACKGGLARSFKRQVVATPKTLARQIVDAAEQRVAGLLLGARRSGFLAFGEEARETLSSGKAALAIVAADAGASATKGPLLGAVEDGRAVAFGTKATLGALFGREEVAVVAVTHRELGAEIQSARGALSAVLELAGGQGERG